MQPKPIFFDGIPVFTQPGHNSEVYLNLPLLSFGWPTIAVDTHIFRVSNRTNFAKGKDVGAVEEKLDKVVLREFKVDVHHWLILHGRYVCTARKPKCGSCLIEDLCEFKDKIEV
ncbi:Endonuclease III [Pseudoalteromonas luteoviolacea B = ATCC 29581]|nr:Endonuclease III [Pseudoalteromonas luteoviolacea B = ATCC 29581]